MGNVKMGRADIVLETRGIVKRFPGVVALKGIDFDLRFGEVHVILGQNGAGKSTFVRVLNGIYTPDRGEIFLHGEKISIKSPRDARRYGITLIHQEVMIVPNLSVAENIFLSTLGDRGVSGLVSSRRPDYRADEAKKYLELIGLNIDPNTKVRDLRISDKQLIQFARALAENAKIICIDELTSALNPIETKRIFSVIEELKKDRSFIFITHRIDEALTIGDRITVLRDGVKVMTRNASEATPSEIVKAMVGKELAELYVYKNRLVIDKKLVKPVLRVENLSTSPQSAVETPLTNISFELYPREILGVVGLLGAGKTELGKTLIGLGRIVHGRIYIDERDVEIKNPIDALNHGIIYLPEDRKLGIVYNLTVSDNIVLPIIFRFSIARFIRRQDIERDIAIRMIKNLNIVTSSPLQKVLNLSGGNQQKVLLGRGMAVKPRILILDEPTFGIDIGSKAEIRRRIKDLVENYDISIILLTSDIDEAISLSDRIMILKSGRVEALIEKRDEEKDFLRDRIIKILSGSYGK